MVSFFCRVFVFIVDFFALHFVTSTGAGDVACHPCPSDFLPAEFVSMVFCFSFSIFHALCAEPDEVKSEVFVADYNHTRPKCVFSFLAKHIIKEERLRDGVRSVGVD